MRLKALENGRVQCARSVLANSILCAKCNIWVNKKCNGISGSLSSVMVYATFECGMHLEVDVNERIVELDLLVIASGLSVLRNVAIHGRYVE